MKKVFTTLLLCIGAIIAGNAINFKQPVFKITPDTLDGAGEINISIAVDNPENTLDGATLTIVKPDNSTKNYLISNITSDFDTLFGSLVFDKYDLPGLYKISNITLSYYSQFSVWDTLIILNDLSFVIKNTTPDTTGPKLFNFKVSKNIGYPGDTVLISFDIQDTISALDNCGIYFNVREQGLAKQFNTRRTEKAKINFKYIVGQYEPLGIRNISVELTDRKLNHSKYNSRDLNFNLEIKGTTPDTVSPVIKSVYSLESSDSLFLYVVAIDNLSGINSDISCNLGFDGGPQHYFFSLENFVKVNDTLFKSNVSQQYPYLPNVNYTYSVSISDNANNSENVNDTITLNNKNSDNEAPVMSWVKFSNDTVFADGEISIEFKLTDNKSGIRNIQGIILNEKTQKYVSFEADAKRDGIKDSTFKVKIKLPKYGPGGVWELNSIFMQDYADNLTGNLPFESAFVYCPKYSDSNPPVFESITFEPKTVNAGDTVIAIVKTRDYESGIWDIQFYINLNFNNKWEMISDGMYKCIIPVSKYAPKGEVSYHLYGISDVADNSNHIDEVGTAFKIMNNSRIDQDPPQFDSLSIRPVNAGKDDTINFHFYIHDGFSGIDASSVNTFFSLNPTEKLDMRGGKGILIKPQRYNAHEYVYSLLPGTALPGKYYFREISAQDSAGNYFETEDEDLLGRYYFEIKGKPQTDSFAPRFISIQAKPLKAKPGDKVEIEIKVVENESSLLKLYAGLFNLSNNNYVALNDWEISDLKNDTFICRGSYTIPMFTYDWKWGLRGMRISDLYGNEYSSDKYYDLFEIINGQPMPNRRPCWVIHNLDFSIDAGKSFNYTIPGYLVSDIDGDKLNYYAKMEDNSDLPSWIAFSKDNLNISINPTNKNNGDHKIMIYVSDPGGLKDTLKVNVNVKPYNVVAFVQNIKTSIYPNPATDFINISSSEIIKSLSLYDLTGKEVFFFSGNRNRIDVSKLTRGIYILKAETQKNTVVEKIILK